MRGRPALPRRGTRWSPQLVRLEATRGGRRPLGPRAGLEAVRIRSALREVRLGEGFCLDERGGVHLLGAEAEEVREAGGGGGRGSVGRPAVVVVRDPGGSRGEPGGAAGGRGARLRPLFGGSCGAPGVDTSTLLALLRPLSLPRTPGRVGPHSADRVICTNTHIW